MKVALTGATGFIGSHVLTDLYKHGHEVTALVRDDIRPTSWHPAAPRRPWLTSTIDRGSRACSVMRTGPSTQPVLVTPPAPMSTPQLSTRRSMRTPAPASPSSRSAVLWVYGANTSITEDSPFQAPALVAWKEPIERRVLAVKDMRGVVVVSGVAYGDGSGGVPGVLLGSPRDDQGNLIMLGTGQQHWSTVHVADLADFFRRVLEHDTARGYYVVGDGLNPTVAELTEAAAVAAGAPGAVPGSDEEARQRLGDYFAEVLLLDQGTVAAKARTELDWSPSHPGLIEEFRHGSYRN